MPLCGLKKSKKREPSPPYSSRVPIPEEAENLLRKKKELEDHIESLQNDLTASNDERRKQHKTIQELQSKLKEAKTESERLKSSVPNDVTDAAESEIRNLAEEAGQKYEAKISELDTAKQSAEDRAKYLSDEIEKLKKEAAKAIEEKDKLKKEKDVIENTLSHTSKELEIARKESHIPRSPTRAPTDEWKNKIETAESELAKERELRLEKERENSRLNSDKDLLQEEKQQLVNEIEAFKQRQSEEQEQQSIQSNLEMDLKNDINTLKETLEEYKKKLEDTETEKDGLLDRLSNATAATVLDNNPNIADLNDPNRPQKLGEQMTQLYDDQWTDATEALDEMGMNDEDLIRTLLDLIKAVYRHCKEAADGQLSRIEEDLFLPPLETNSGGHDTNGTEPVKSPTSKQSMSRIPRFTSHKGRPALPNVSSEKKTVDTDTPTKERPKRSLSYPKVKGEKLPEVPVEIRKGIKEYRKKVTKQVWPVIEKEVYNKLRKSEEFEERVIDGCKSYISKCVELCWLMRVQDPPVHIDWSFPGDRSFDSDVYRAYTKSGPKVEYVVWPVVYLHEDGPVLVKGVAQGTEE